VVNSHQHSFLESFGNRTRCVASTVVTPLSAHDQPTNLPDRAVAPRGRRRSLCGCRPCSAANLIQLLHVILNALPIVEGCAAQRIARRHEGGGSTFTLGAAINRAPQPAWMGILSVRKRGFPAQDDEGRINSVGIDALCRGDTPNAWIGAPTIRLSATVYMTPRPCRRCMRSRSWFERLLPRLGCFAAESTMPPKWRGQYSTRCRLQEKNSTG
jgi:hypothetical protein